MPYPRVGLFHHGSGMSRLVVVRMRKQVTDLSAGFASASPSVRRGCRRGAGTERNLPGKYLESDHLPSLRGLTQESGSLYGNNVISAHRDICYQRRRRRRGRRLAARIS